MKKLLLATLFIFFIPCLALGTEYWVRDAAGEYPPENGLSYATAFDGLGDIAGLSSNDIVYICGTHNRSTSYYPDFDGAVGATIVFDGDCYNGGTPDPGILDGGSNQIHLFALNTDDYIEFRNLTFRNWQGHATSLYCAIKVEDSLGVYIHDTVIFSDETGKAIGIYILGASDNGIIRDSTIHTVFNGIRFDDKSTVVANNFLVSNVTIYNVAQHTPTDADGIVFFGTGGTNDYSGTTVENSEISDFADHGVDTCGGTNIGLLYNEIHDNDYSVTADGGGVKLNCNENESTINMVGNLIYNITGNLNPVGIMGGNSVGNIFNNTVVNCGDWCLNYPNDDPVGIRTISNNIFKTCGDEGTNSCITYTRADTGDVTNNSFYDCNNGVTNEDATVSDLNNDDPDASGNIDGDPLLDDNYVLLEDSPAIDTGLNLGASYQLDFDGRNQNHYGDDWEIGIRVYRVIGMAFGGEK
jgi:hypothetical protein